MLRIEAVCSEYGVPLPVAAVQYPLQEPSVVSVVVGGARPEQVRQNALNVDAVVPAELWQRLRDEGLVAL